MRVRRSSKTMLLQRGIFTKIAYSKTHNNINHPLLSEGTCLHVHSVPKKDISDFNVFNTPWPDPLSSHYVKSSKFYVMQISSQEKKRKKKANMQQLQDHSSLTFMCQSTIARYHLGVCQKCRISSLDSDPEAGFESAFQQDTKVILAYYSLTSMAPTHWFSNLAIH